VNGNRLVDPVVDYYAARFAEFGATAKGVDWNSQASQTLRFEQLLKVHDGTGTFTLDDFGCGYGALAAYLRERFADFAYTGFDLAAAMLDDARSTFAGDPRISFVGRADGLQPADYVVASGVFNIRLQAGVPEWEGYVTATLDRLWELSTAGLGFNALTSYSDPNRMRSDLWYADPRVLFDLCKRRYSGQVALLHDYGLFEFTLLVRRSGGV
jgi:SAM-dependent methyltransferase